MREASRSLPLVVHQALPVAAPLAMLDLGADSGVELLRLKALVPLLVVLLQFSRQLGESGIPGPALQGQPLQPGSRQATAPRTTSAACLRRAAVMPWPR